MNRPAKRKAPGGDRPSGKGKGGGFKGGGRGRGRGGGRGGGRASAGRSNGAGGGRGAASLEEDLDSGESDDEDREAEATFGDSAGIGSDDDEVAETADERRVRMAKEMISSMDDAAQRARRARNIDDGDDDGDAVAAELEEDALRAAGRWRAKIASSLRGADVAADAVRTLRGPKLSPTCVALASDESAAYCGSKGGAITRWDLGSGARLKLSHAKKADGSGHTSDVLAIALSRDGRLLATGGRDKAVLLWDTRTHTVVKQLRGHKGAVTALATRRDAVGSTAAGAAGAGEQLYTASADRMVKVWDVAQRAYVETLFGHQEGVCALDALTPDTLVTGSADRSLRLWKVADETQLVFNGGHTAAVDCCSMLSATAFASGSQDGALALWSSQRKRPLATVAAAHGESQWGGPAWLTSLAAPPFSDLLISGSHDGRLRFWHADEGGRSLTPVMSAPLVGFVNGLAVAPSGRFVVAAVGQEHRLGRWFRIPEARNSLAVVPLPEAAHRRRRLLGAGDEAGDDEGDDDDDEEGEDDADGDDGARRADASRRLARN